MIKKFKDYIIKVAGDSCDNIRISLELEIQKVNDEIIILRKQIDVLADNIAQTDKKMLGIQEELGNRISSMHESVKRIKEEGADSDQFLSTRIDYALERIQTLEEVKNLIDEGMLHLTRRDFDNMVHARLSKLETEVDYKVIGLYKTVDEKMARVGDNGRALAESMRKVAKLEGLKDSMDNRRCTDELMEKREELRRERLQMEQKGTSTAELDERIRTLNWVLGEDKNG